MQIDRISRARDSLKISLHIRLFWTETTSHTQRASSQCILISVCISLITDMLLYDRTNLVLAPPGLYGRPDYGAYRAAPPGLGESPSSFFFFFFFFFFCHSVLMLPFSSSTGSGGATWNESSAGLAAGKRSTTARSIFGTSCQLPTASEYAKHQLHRASNPFRDFRPRNARSGRQGTRLSVRTATIPNGGKTRRSRISGEYRFPAAPECDERCYAAPTANQG